jgi:hypothetical protein
VDERHNFRNREIEHLIHLIVKDAYSQSRREEVRAFVEDQLRQLSNTAFALHESDGFWEVHRAGVRLFRADSLEGKVIPR